LVGERCNKTVISLRAQNIRATLAVFWIKTSSNSAYSKRCGAVRRDGESRRGFSKDISLGSQLKEAIPITLNSPHAIPPAHRWLSLLELSDGIKDSRRLAHTDWLRFEEKFHVIPGDGCFRGIPTNAAVSQRCCLDRF
jgi:hypothetical protein